MDRLRRQRAGALSEQITVIREIERVADSGSVSKEWGTVAVLRAELVKQETSEEGEPFGQSANGPVIYRLRHYPEIRTTDQLVADNRLFDIEKIAEIGKRMMELHLTGIDRAVPTVSADFPPDPEKTGRQFVLASANW